MKHCCRGQSLREHRIHPARDWETTLERLQYPPRVRHTRSSKGRTTSWFAQRIKARSEARRLQPLEMPVDAQVAVHQHIRQLDHSTVKPMELKSSAFQI